MKFAFAAVLAATLLATIAFAQTPKLATEETMVKSPDPGIEIYVRNKHPAGMTSFRSERTLLFVHGATYPASTTFDLPLDGESWMDYIAARVLSTKPLTSACSAAGPLSRAVQTVSIGSPGPGVRIPSVSATRPLNMADGRKCEVIAHDQRAIGSNPVQHPLARLNSLLTVIVEKDGPLWMLEAGVTAMRNVGHVDKLVVSG